jgi:hypothetical protein
LALIVVLEPGKLQIAVRTVTGPFKVDGIVPYGLRKRDNPEADAKMVEEGKERSLKCPSILDNMRKQRVAL